MIYATISGQRGKQTPVSVVRVSPDGRGTPFVTGILNATGLAFNPDGDLFVTSRAEGTVYRVDAAGEFTVYAEGMGVATGAAFDARAICLSATAAAPFSKSIPSARSSSTPRWSQASPPITWPSTRAGRFSSPLPRSRPTTPSGPSSPTATPAPGIAAWAVRRALRSRVTAASTSPPASTAAAAWCASPRRAKPALVLAGNNLVGVAFSPLGTAVLATNEAVYDVDLGVEGLNLF